MSQTVFTLLVPEVRPPRFFVTQIAVVLVVCDHPTPLPVTVDENDAAPIIDATATLRVGFRQHRERVLDDLDGNVRPATDGLRGHVHTTLPIREHKQVHEHMANDVILGD